jgi:hypothetical protein
MSITHFCHRCFASNAFADVDIHQPKFGHFDDPRRVSKRINPLPPLGWALQLPQSIV